MAYKFNPEAKYAKSHDGRAWRDLSRSWAYPTMRSMLSDVVYVELPEVGDTLIQGESMGTVESVKAAEDRTPR